MNRQACLVVLMLWLHLDRPPLAVAQSQEELNVQAYQHYQQSDAALNTAYQALLLAHHDNPLYLKKLQESQKAWIQFRDAQIDALWPEPDKLSNYGSIWPMCRSEALDELTRARTDQLKRMLTGHEGDMCGWN